MIRSLSIKRFNTSWPISNNCVPQSQFDDKDIIKLKNFMIQNRNKKLLVLTGAGISTESGIPDYRSPLIGVYAKSNNQKLNIPVTYQEFVSSSFERKRFWARHYIGYIIYESKTPNINHYILASWESKSILSHLITQNVDSLHEKAGNKMITFMHGNFKKVICLKCENSMDRSILQEKLEQMNIMWKYNLLSISPDAYVHINEEDVKYFNAPFCESCGSDMLKPDVVMIGENIKSSKLNEINDQINKAQYLLVLGTSLMMYSAYQIVMKSKQKKYPIAIINIGKTRADHLTDIKLEGQCGHILKELNYWMESCQL